MVDFQMADKNETYKIKIIFICAIMMNIMDERI